MTVATWPGRWRPTACTGRAGGCRSRRYAVCLPAHAHVGASAHSLEEARGLDADFLTLSPIFEPISKSGHGPPLGLEALTEVCHEVRRPVYALGGVTPTRVRPCLEAGAWGVAVLGGIMAAPDPWEAARAYLAAL